MDTQRIIEPPGPIGLAVCLLLSIVLLVGSMILASLVQRDFGRVEVSNISYPNYNGIIIRAKLFRPLTASARSPVPGIVYAHGYQNNRETSDAYSLELARRGFAVLAIDAIGRGNSGEPGNPKAPDFDKTYGVYSSFQFLKTLPFVSRKALGLMGHSLGAEWAYTTALRDGDCQALAFSGFAYRLDASAANPKNMLMIIGKWDEFRKRMTGVGDIEKEWMQTPRTGQVIPFPNPRLGETYGDFSRGTARRVFVPPITHVQETHNQSAIAEALSWMGQALNPSPHQWIDSRKQIWPLKEWSTLTAMLSGLAAMMFLGALLLKTPFFKELHGLPSPNYSCASFPYVRLAAQNGIIMWLYLPLIFVLFGLHVYVVPIDRVFPMMMVNGTVWWFFWINVIGFFLFRRWLRKTAPQDLTLADLGLSYGEDRMAIDGKKIFKTILLGVLLFIFAYGSEHLLEYILIVDFRFWFPFASDLTPYRALVGLIYFPFILAGFLGTGIFIHGQLRRPFKRTWLTTYRSWTLSNLGVLIVPLILFLLIQYVPLFSFGIIPLVGPGGMFVTFILNLVHIILVLLLIIPISTWFYQWTGKIYLGALISALLVAWMFASSQVIAPVPV
jgi:pimeloyl-ACP methyl ester carboxylesterase